MEPERGYLSNHTMEQLRQTVPMAGQGELVSICWGEAAGEPQPKGAKPRSSQTTPHDNQIDRAVGGTTGADG